MHQADPFDLERFVDAQRGVLDVVVAQLRAGRKTSHWMWFVFPQLSGLGASTLSRRYALSGLAEAAAYLAHPTLGSRLRDHTRLVLAVDHRSSFDIFGSPDDRKFHSSMTVFDALGAADVFPRALDRFFGGEGDAATLALLRRPTP
jgi:uncharacterized protein (DUF1810 family)